jgi:TRAP-type mannitol/chloroaromatic compound transport system permease small subunit
VFGLLLFLSFFGLVTWHGIGVLQQSIQSGSHSQSAIETPLVIPQALWIAGLMAFLLTGLVLLIHALGLALRGDAAGMANAIGTRSAEEEVEDEIKALKDRQANGETR